MEKANLELDDRLKNTIGTLIDQQQQMEFMTIHLKSIDPIVLAQRIKLFRNLNLKNMTDEVIREKISDVLLWNGLFSYYLNIAVYPAGTLFYRVRKLNDSVIPISNFNQYSDFWEPPADVIKNCGRLNKPGEPLLYTTPGDTTVPLLETHLQENDFYALIQYVANQNIKVNVIGGEYDYPARGIQDREAILIHELYNDFLQTEFSRDVGVGTEYLYRISEIIAKDYFDLPPRVVQDAWAYGSIQDKNKYNVCFRPEIAHEMLDLKGAMICKKRKDEVVVAHCVAIPNVDKNGIEFYEIGSEIQKTVFPDIVKT